MKCPACDNQLTKMGVGDVTVDVCKGGCGGIWFDSLEIKKLDERHEHLGQELLDISVDHKVRLNHSKRRRCPRCGGVTMMRHFFSVKKQVELDECAACGGIWLDNGELKEIRSLFETEEERNQAAREYLDEVFGEQLAQMRKESQEKLEKARAIARIFRFICPSYYIPGDQDWGAF